MADVPVVASRRQLVLLILVALLIGSLVWSITMASAPRYSFGPDQEAGNYIFVPVLLVCAVVGGCIAREWAALVGVALGLPALLMSPWTAARGDNDGLWLLIVPFLAWLTGVLGGTALLASMAHRRIDPSRNLIT